MSWLRISYAWYMHYQFEHDCDLDFRHITLDLLYSTLSFYGGHLAKCLDSIIGRRLCKLCSVYKFSTAKWHVTLALDILVCVTSPCYGGHFIPSDMIKGRWLWMFKELLSWPLTLTIQIRVCTRQITCYVGHMCLWCDNQEKVRALKTKFSNKFPLILACGLALGLIYYPLVILHTCTEIWKSKGIIDRWSFSETWGKDTKHRQP